MVAHGSIQIESAILRYADGQVGGLGSRLHDFGLCHGVGVFGLVHVGAAVDGVGGRGGVYNDKVVKVRTLGGGLVFDFGERVEVFGGQVSTLELHHAIFKIIIMF